MADDMFEREDVARALAAVAVLGDGPPRPRGRVRTQLTRLGLDAEGAVTAVLDWSCADATSGEPDPVVAGALLVGLGAGLSIADVKARAAKKRGS